METIKFADIWNTLSKVDCSEHLEDKQTGKNTLKYLSWAWAWGIAMKHYPEATYTIREWEGKPWLNDPVLGVLVMTEVDIGGNKRGMWLPAMDGANNALKDHDYTYTVKGYNGPIEKTVKAVDMMDINKAIMRCLVKNLAMFGLGLNVYAGEDLPVGEEGGRTEGTPTKTQLKEPLKANPPQAPKVASEAKPEVKKPQAKGKVNPLGMEAWKAFRALPMAAKMTDAARNESFKNLVKEQTNKVNSEDLTPEEWHKVINEISILAAM